MAASNTLREAIANWHRGTTFIAAPTALYVSMHTADPLLTGANEVASPVNEVQTVTVTGATGGTITLTYSGQTTATITHTATAGTVQTRLENLSNIAVGDVVCTGGPLNTAAVTCTFQGLLGGQNLAQMTVDATALTGGSAAVATTTAGGSTLGYQRQSLTLSAPTDDGVDELIENTNLIVFGPAAGAGFTPAFFGIQTSYTGGSGTFVQGGACTAQAVPAGGFYRFEIGALDLTIR